MKFDTPAAPNPIDRGKVVGKPVDRIDGPLKTTGTAPYAYERHDVAPNAAYGYILGAAVAKGRITAIDDNEARRAPGVIAVVTYRNAGKLGKAKAIGPILLGTGAPVHVLQTGDEVSNIVQIAAVAAMDAMTRK